MSLTIKEIADQLNVSKTAIRKHMDDSFRDTYTEKDGNKILITDEGVDELKQQFANSKAVDNDSKSDTDDNNKKTTDESSTQGDTGSNVPAANPEEFQLLSEQLDEQVKQLKAKDKQIAELHQLLDQSQRLQLDVQKKLKQLETRTAEQTKAIETSATDDSSDQESANANENNSNMTDDDKRHWWQVWKKD
ncbi:HTH domain-containing protein [Lentilactobacillus sp. SPB1-3]|uniref:Replication protein B n=1 Tax=Lentilactobacillus terminaliae TaxID=3003483 RepID=A0ACD5DF71_9LACO|nr:HTH domain-containing protein [Lentilactobacillus sp. SPB1-3]MCZ0976282.1 HTH domain-containing protein [Lentilactobacillus sp. SPB1-3]